MEKELKDNIVQAVNAFMSDNGMKASEFARKADVNESYFSYVSRGIYIYQNTEIKDAFFRKIAQACNFAIEPTYWRHVATDQFKDIIYKFDEAHKHKYLNLIIGETGAGKSYAVERYCQIHPLDTLVVTINNNDDIYSILDVLAKQLRIPLAVKRSLWIRNIADAIKRKSQEGITYLMIIDEAENSRVPSIKAYKAFFDLVVKPGYCGMAITGTPGLLTIIDRFERYGQEGMSQFKRRVKAGLTILNKIDKKQEFEKFMDAAKIEDKGLRKLLIRQCANYGELHDYLERAIRIADEEERPLNEELFREIYDIN